MEDIVFIKGFVQENCSASTEDYYRTINESAFWHTQLNITGTSDTKTIRRAMAYHSDISSVYNYANFNFQGAAWFPELLNIKYDIESRLDLHAGNSFNSVLLNRYDNGKDEIRWHTDKEESLGDMPLIACVNFGATRKFWFMRKKDGKKFFIEVEDGDLLVMGEMCQKKYMHAILKEAEVTTPRISLTYRRNHTDKSLWRTGEI